MGDFVLAIDQGTTSTRAVIVDHGGRLTAQGQLEHRQHFPRAGWVEHDPVEIWDRTREVIARALARADLTHRDLAAVGLTNQRETTVVWDRRSGAPIHPAIVWQDVRTQQIVDRLGADDGVRAAFTERTGLPLATYFAGPKVRWILDHVDGAQAAAERGELAFGTIDTWLLWNATGGPDGGVHLTDVTNASRTALMDLETLDWDPELLAALRIPRAMLPEIRPSSGQLARAHRDTLLAGAPITGMLGDQHAATFGQACFTPGQAKNTYGTGNFMLLNTGPTAVRSQHGLLTTVAYQLAGQPPTYALEGSIAVTGSLVQWLRDNLGLIDSAADIEALAASVPDAGGAVVVPAFSGLFAPHWRPDARGAIVGLTRYVTKAHLARAALEATAFQTREVLDAMDADSGVPLTELRVDGGMVVNDLLMQTQADLLGVPVVRPRVTETSALGAAYAAGLAVGYWDSLADIEAHWHEDARWEPAVGEDEREQRYRRWRKAVSRTLNWID